MRDEIETRRVGFGQRMRGMPRIGLSAAIFVVSVMSGIVLVGVGPAAADVTSVSGGAFGVSSAGLLTVNPTPSVTLPAGGGGPFTASATSGLVPAQLDVGPVNVSTEGSNVPGPDGNAISSASATDIDLGAGALEISAVASSCESQAFGSTAAVAIGSISIDGTPISGIPNPVPENYPLTVPGFVTVELNYQVTSDSEGATGLIADGIYIDLSGGVGVIQVAQSSCGANGPDVETAPTVTGLTPTDGPTSGGTKVTVTGTDFSPSSTVEFGSDAGTDVTWVSPSEITVDSPPQGAGPVNVKVSDQFGTSPAASAGVFTYIASPHISAISPTSGPTSGGTSVTITGNNLGGGTVTIGGQSVTAVCTDTACTFTTPPGAAGPTAVVVTTPFGNDGGTFTYIPAPNVTGLTPSSGPTTGGTPVTITGTNFGGGTVTVNGQPVTATCTDTACTFTTPPGTAGPVSVTVTTPNGSSSGTFTYLPVPKISGLAPPSGPTAGGTVVTITGTNFGGGTVTIGGLTVGASCTDTACTFTTPAHAAGPVVVKVTNGNGSGSGTFTYIAAAPTVTSVNPPTGPSYGGTQVVIRGTNFSTAPGGTTFEFGGVTATNVFCSGPTDCSAITPIGLGTVKVTATVAGKTSVASKAAEYEFVPGYYLVGGGGDVYAFGDARNLGSVPSSERTSPAVSIAFDPATHGYWVVESSGQVVAFGAPSFVERSGYGTPSDIVAITSTPSGNGFWLVSSAGYVYPYGGAGYFGEIAPKKLSKPVLGISTTPTGKGYFLLASDGGIFNYGDALFYGSTGAEGITSPVVGMSVDRKTGGYWLVTANGTVYNFNAPFFGDRAGEPLNKPVLGIIATPGGNGYYLVAADGGVFAYGQATFFGSLGAKPPATPVVGMAFEG